MLNWAKIFTTLATVDLSQANFSNAHNKLKNTFGLASAYTEKSDDCACNVLKLSGENNSSTSLFTASSQSKSNLLLNNSLPWTANKISISPILFLKPLEYCRFLSYMLACHCWSSGKSKAGLSSPKTNLAILKKRSKSALVIYDAIANNKSIFDITPLCELTAQTGESLRSKLAWRSFSKSSYDKPFDKSSKIEMSYWLELSHTPANKNGIRTWL